MLIIFVASLVLLVALLLLKIYEIRAGRRLFLPTFRDQADQLIRSGLESVQSRHRRTLYHTKSTLRRKLTSWRYRFSDWLEDLAQKLRK